MLCSWIVFLFTSLCDIGMGWQSTSQGTSIKLLELLTRGVAWGFDSVRLHPITLCQKMKETAEAY